MSPEEIGDAALEFDAGPARDEFIANACGTDAALRALVLEYVSGGEMLAVDPVIEDHTPQSLENRQIGPWKLLRRLGEGGCGVVYLAERNDGQVRQLGAMKFLKGTVQHRDLELRFLDERQILANLNHPWIVHLIDVGISREGQRYLVMEFAEDALPIDAYCREHQLPLKDRLVLFRKVCEAVMYAHRKLVVHRDLKPGNILVASDGTPRLLDFGVAKILDPVHRGSAQAASSTNILVGTERYFSPEQARREPVDTATDIYSLGVVLYELSAGTDPYDLDRHGQQSIEQIICTVDPQQPSKAIARSSLEPRARQRLRRQLEGDLDNIILMALRKEPHRRYASVDHFSEDIRRHLQGVPVSARPPTLNYRASKFIQRHKAAIAAAALVVLSLIGGLIATAWQARRAEAAQARAERRFDDVRKLATSNLFEFHDEIAKVPGTTAARALVVRRALEYLGSLANEATGDRQLQLELATAYERVGDAQGRPGFANLGDRTGALESYRKALEIRKTFAPGGVPDGRRQLDLATNYNRIGDVLLVTGESAGALANYREGYRLTEALLSTKPDDREIRREYAGSCQRIAQALLQTGKLAEAQEMQHRALALFEALAAAHTADAITKRDLFISYVKEGDLLRAAGDKAGALRRYREALPVATEVEAIADNRAKAARETASVRDKIGNLLFAQKDLAGAMENYRAALRARAAIAATDPKNAEIQRDLSISHEKIGSVLARFGDSGGALAEHRESLKIDTTLLAGDPDNAQARLDCASDHDDIGELLMKLGDFSGALAQQNQARELREWVASKDEKNVEVRGDLALNYKRLGIVSVSLGKKTANPEYLRAADGWFTRGVQVLRDLRQRGSLDQDGVAELSNLANEISKCEAALKASQAVATTKK